MRYPKIGEQVRVKNETGLHTVINLHKNWGGLGVMVLLSDGRKKWLENLVTRHQKTVLTYVVQQHFGDGWEDVTEEEILSEAITRRKEYRENTRYPTRIIRRREPNDLYQK